MLSRCGTHCADTVAGLQIACTDTTMAVVSWEERLNTSEMKRKSVLETLSK